MESLLARAYKRILGHKLAQDSGEHWVTVNAGSKEGGEGGGSHVLLDGEGRVVAGMGGKFKGQNIDRIERKKFINQNAWNRQRKALTEKAGEQDGNKMLSAGIINQMLDPENAFKSHIATGKKNLAEVLKRSKADTTGMGLINMLHTGIETEQAELKAKQEAELKDKQEATRPKRQDDNINRNRIDDFGEKLEGARKMLGLTANLSAADLKTMPLSKSWPISEIEAVTNDEKAAMLYAIRQSIPKKPSSTKWGGLAVNEWARDVQQLREMGQSVLEDRLSPEMQEKLIKILGTNYHVYKNLNRTTWGQVVSSSQEKLHGAWLNDSILKNEKENIINLNLKLNPNGEYDVKRTSVTINGRGSISVYSTLETSDNEIFKVINDRLMFNNPSSALAEKKAKAKTYKFSIYYYPKTGVYFVAKDGDKNKTPLQEFNSVREARDFLKNEDNHAVLTEAYDAVSNTKKTTESDFRFIKDMTRIGAKRHEENTTPEDYNNAFGFRGVQFGNWVAQSGELSRQNLMNHAYDALMDLADVIGIDTKDISLNGSLGFAFGARGLGKALAHYEPASKVINLTKYGGSGCVAHEWFHALDNFIGGETLYGTRRATDYKEGAFMKSDLGQSFVELTQAIRKSEYYNRAQEYDKYRSKKYWSDIIELAARGFEAYVKHKLDAKGAKNNFLVNYIEEGQVGMWPNKTEIKTLAPYYENLIEAIKKFKKGNAFSDKYRKIDNSNLNEYQKVDNISNNKNTQNGVTNMNTNQESQATPTPTARPTAYDVLNAKLPDAVSKTDLSEAIETLKNDRYAVTEQNIRKALQWRKHSKLADDLIAQSPKSIKLSDLQTQTGLRSILPKDVDVKSNWTAYNYRTGYEPTTRHAGYESGNKKTKPYNDLVNHESNIVMFANKDGAPSGYGLVTKNSNNGVMQAHLITPETHASVTDHRIRQGDQSISGYIANEEAKEKASREAERQARIAKEGKSYNGTGIEHKNGRYEISFNSFPSFQLRYDMKENGFRWDPNAKVWHTTDREKLDQVLGKHFTERT